MLFNWPRRYSRENLPVRKAIRPRRRPAFRLHLEHLENRLVPATTSILHSFAGPTTDGSSPEFGRLMEDSNGNLFGTTTLGGTGNQGMVFELVKNGNSYTETVLYSFFVGSDSDGAKPNGGLIADGNGDLFGTTQDGGAHVLGTVFELVKSGNSYTETVLYSFAGGSDGANPYGTLIMDSNGDLFGTTDHGGGSDVGTVFEMVKNGSSYNAPTILHAFAGGSDGAFLQFGVIADGNGNLFGTTNQGGGRAVTARSSSWSRAAAATPRSPSIPSPAAPPTGAAPMAP